MREYYITKNDSGQRLNKFLEKAVPRLSGGMMHKYLRLKRIKLNKKRYYLDEDGILQTGTLTIDGKKYTFAADGSIKK